MGSGDESSYSGTNGQSQPYAPFYHVVPKMLALDKKNGIYHNGRYDKNPTAEPLVNKISGSYIGSKTTNMKIPYVIDKKGNIIVGIRNGNGRGAGALPTPHPTLIGGKNPKVKMAGILEIRGGKIYSYDDRSGHFRPNKKSLACADEAFDKLDPKLFSKSRSN